MPNKKSAEKALRQSNKRFVLNLRRKRDMRDLFKQGLGFIEQGKTADAEKLIPAIFKAVDKAAKRGVIKKNTAARRKSMYVRAIERSKKEPVKATKKTSSSVSKSKSTKKKTAAVTKSKAARSVKKK